MREYALEQLVTNGEVEAIRYQHTSFFLALAEKLVNPFAKPDRNRIFFWTGCAG
jgi:hypothetical protein